MRNSSSPAADRRILYATQTGRSRACARRVARLIGSSYVSTFDDDVWFQTSLDNIITASNHSNNKPLLILIVSTTGDGEQTDSIRNTWNKLLQKSLPNDLFRGVGFFVFGVGDRAYGEQFCAAARKLIVRMQQLGAVLAQKPEFGDSGNGNFWAEFDDWLESKLFPALGVDLLLSNKQEDLDLFWDSKYTVKEIEADDKEEEISVDDLYAGFRETLAPATAFKRVPTNAIVLENKRLTPIDWDYDTRHIRLRMTEESPYNAGDVATILPRNNPTRVDAFLRVLPISIQALADAPLHVRCKEEISRWPDSCTLRGWLTHCADMEALPEREDLRLLAGLCSLSHEHGFDQRSRLRYFSETKGTALYADYIVREKRCWTDVMYDFDSLHHEGSKMTLGHLFSLLSPLRPREFSIASAPSSSVNGAEGDTTILELCVGVVGGTTRLGRTYHGLCSNFLARSISHETSVHVWIRPGLFDANSPGPLLWAGTGIAPLRSILLERRHSEGDSLVFGCRKEDADCYYADDWSHLSSFRVAYSRQEPKTYVQQILTPNELAEHGGSIYVAGNPRMARAIQASLLLGIEKSNQVSGQEARKLLRGLQRSGRFVVEAWS